MKEQILIDFKKSTGTFNEFKDRMIRLLRDLLEKENIIAHQIIGRTKDIDSLSKKIDKKGEKYKSLYDITDLVGLRIITYLESDVDQIAAIIEREFEKDVENSIDKRILKNDQFGYRSLHFVIALNKNRSGLSEYSKYKSLKCEIQIRSILQHAWAEIEHDLGYKSTDVPDDYKRSFNRVAALLETADLEFIKLKSQLSHYETAVPDLIETSPAEVDINKASLSSFLTTDNLVLEARKVIIEETGYRLRKAHSYELVIEILKYHNITTIQELQIALEKIKTRYFDFLRSYITIRSLKRVLSEIVILTYLGHFLVLLNDDLEELESYIAMFAPDAIDELTQDLLKSYQNARGY